MARLLTRSAARERVPERARFEQLYREHILSTAFLEEGAYYRRYKARYWHSLRALCRLPLPRPAEVVEIGGGQLAMLMHMMFGDRGTVVDVSETFREGVVQKGLGFARCDLLHDDLSEHAVYDLAVMCEVIEHMPVPPYQVLSKLHRWLKPGGALFVTTPNLYRLRNLVRLAANARVFDRFLIPRPGEAIGHPLEYGPAHLRWQLEEAGFECVRVERRQLDNGGGSWQARVGRVLVSPLMLRPAWREKLVAVAWKPGSGEPAVSPETVGAVG